FFFSSRRRHTRFDCDWSSDVCSSDLKYDPATKTFTYSMEMEPMPGMKTKVREVLKLTDDTHMFLEWYEMQGGKEKKTMEITYTRSEERRVGKECTMPETRIAAEKTQE